MSLTHTDRETLCEGCGRTDGTHKLTCASVGRPELASPQGRIGLHTDPDDPLDPTQLIHCPACHSLMTLAGYALRHRCKTTGGQP